MRSHSTSRPVRAMGLAAAAVLAAGALTAGCGRSTTGSSDSGDRVASAKSARDLLPKAVKDAGVLKAVTAVGYPPMEMYKPGTRVLTGVDPDLAAAVAKRLGLRLTLSNAEFDGLIPGIQGGRWDIAFSSVSDTAERRKAVDFVDYFRAGGSILVKKGNPEGIKTLADLCGKKIVAAKGSSNLAIAQKQAAKCGAKKMPIAQSEDAPTGLLSIDTGRADATIVDYPAGVEYAKSGKYQVLTTQYAAGPWGAVLSRTNPDLRDAVQKALQEMRKDGTYKKILDDYGVGINALPAITVNTKA
ncbi:MAG TPA: ABC transporter substrate-binding protein [Streptosporangiaceae bacterium]